jgi:beta-barrel assembly-enhancing protease
MRRWVTLTTIVVLSAGALTLSERRRVEAPVRPDPIVYFIADTQRELTRLPVAFARLSDEDEIRIGNDLAGRYGAGWPLSDQDSRVVEAYVQLVGLKVAGRAQRKLPYKFHYIPGPYFINAFALPGGHVFIGEGLMLLMQSEDELAAVLGHEVEHIDHYHCAERVQTEEALRRIPLGGLIALPVEVFQAGYSKDQELEADREGTRLAGLASYSPQGAIDMFETFDRLFDEHVRRAETPGQELSRVAMGSLQEYFQSHPRPSDRAAQIRRMMSDEHWWNLTRQRDLEVAYIFVTYRADRALANKQYTEAAGLAARSLGLHADQPKALRILAEAKFALADFASAAATYHQLLEKYPTDADAVRTFADGLASQALAAGHYDQAEKLAIHSLELQPNQPGALKVLAKAQLELLDSAGAVETYQKLKNMYPNDADEVIEYAATFAEQALHANHYGKAAKFAAFSLEFRPKQVDTLKTLAAAQTALANFDAAAGANRKLLEIGPVDADLVQDYADALGATRQGQKAAQEFQVWASSLKPSDKALATQAQIELAGLEVLAGNGVPAKEVIARAKEPGGGGIPPESLGRLAWWFYRAGDYTASSNLLRWALDQRPGSLMLQTDLAWTELEQRKLDDAIQRFTLAASDTSIWYTPTMGRAVARWQAHQAEDALRDFASAINTEPQWLNPKLVQAFYSPLVANSVVEIEAEREKRLIAEQKR